MFKYSVEIMWTDEDDCYVAKIPEFPGLSAFGDTPEEAAEEARIAAEGFIDVYEEDGCKLPAPQKHVSFSGQTRLRLPKSLHEALSLEAKREGISLNTHIVSLLSQKSLAAKTLEKFESLNRHISSLLLAAAPPPSQSEIAGTEKSPVIYTLTLPMVNC